MGEAKQSQLWDQYWQGHPYHEYWLEPDPAVVELVKGFDKEAVRDALDLGCGIGRHAVLLAETGLNVTAVDASGSALARLAELAGKRSNVRLIEGDYSQDLFEAGSFDFVLAWNVLYHGSRGQFKDAVRLIHKWLRPGGIFFFTCPTRRDAKYASGTEISPNAFRSLNSIHPGDVHYFADEGDLADFLCDFTVVSKSAYEHYWDNEGKQQFSSYWRVLAKR